MDDVVLAVSELVTNAVRHGRPPVTLDIDADRGTLRVGVEDALPDAPRRLGGQQVPLAESGRGLDIVQAVASELSSERIPDDGKVVYAVLPAEVPGPPSAR